MSVALSYENVTRRFPGVEALCDVNLQIPEGCVYGIIGRNGAGKSTLLRMPPALLRPTSGTVKLLGKDPWLDESVRAHTGYVSDTEGYPRSLRLRDLMELQAGLIPRWDGALAHRLLERFSLDGRSRLGTLSRGQNRQAELIAAVCRLPRVLILDEPGAGLDPMARRDLLEVVLDLVARERSTVVFSSHQLSEVERIATRIAILHGGKLLADGPLDELKESACRVELRGRGLNWDTLRKQLPAIRIDSMAERHRLTLRCRPDDAAEFLRAHLPRDAVEEVGDAQALNLEELFTDWTADRP